MRNLSKKLIAVILVGIMLLTVLMQAGCGGTTDPTETTTSPESTPSVTPEETTPVATPEATTPEATTPEATTPEATTPEATTPETTPAVTPPETTPVVDVTYNISYDLDGGYEGGNPTKYSSNEGATVSKYPIKPGYDFIGWTGNGITEPTKTVTVAAGTEGDLVFKANWAEDTKELSPEQVNDKYFNIDDGLTAKEGEIPVSEHDMLGARGEGIFILKTVYTDVVLDGEMDAAYTYGLHFEGDLYYDLTFYNDREPASFDVYMIRSQNGKINIFIEVIDPEIVINSYIFKKNSWHCDSMDFYYEYGNAGISHNVYNFMADDTGTFKKAMPEGTKIKVTDTGYIIETAIDNDGMPFNEYDELGFGFYLNEARDWNEEDKTYVKNIIKNHSVLNPKDKKRYEAPSPAIYDAVMVTTQSATGKVDVFEGRPEKSGDMLTDIMNGSASVLITYDDYATAQTILAARDLKNIICGAGGNVSLKLESAVSPDMTFDYEILFGKTTREASKNLMNALSYNEYGISITGNTVALIGWNEDNAGSAYDIFCEILEDIVFNGAKTENFGIFYSGVNEKLAGDAALRLEGFDSITDVGEDAYLVYKIVSTMDEYNAYCAQLVEGGYTLYTTNIMNKVHCATYYNDDTVVSVQFANGGKRNMQNLNPDNSLRIVIEPLSNTKLPSLTKPEDADAEVTVSSITLMHPHNLCMVVQLSNGHYIIIDSGNNGTQRVLSDFLRDNAPDKNNVVIEAWIMTHFHQDHIGGFVDYMGVSSLTRYITVENVIYNFPQWQALNTASSKDINNLNLWYNVIKPSMIEKGTTFYQARTGQKYYFGNAEIEILWTFEDIMPTNIFVDSTNQTDIGFSITIEGQKIMITGDSAENEFRMAAYKFGDYLKSDMVQLAHHGGGNGMGEHDFYKLVDAPIVFHPNPKTDGYPNPGANERWAVNNAELVIRSGNYGIATLKLPFKIGDDITSTLEPKDELGK